jgi:6-phosphofructokinase
MTAIKRIGILTGGGDVPGLNVAIKAAVMRGFDHGIEVVGLRRGWMSVLTIDPDDDASVAKWTWPLTRDVVRTFDRTGGTLLHSSRTNPSAVKPADVPACVRAEDQQPGAGGKIDCTKHALRVLAGLGLDALIAIGGDDTLSFANRLHREGFRVCGIPKTMDNDVHGTDYCIGFSTAVTRSVDALVGLRTPLGSHERIGVIELFGRNSGASSFYSGHLAAVDRILIAEVPFDIAHLAELLTADRERNPSHYAMVTVSEGAQMLGGEVIETGEADAYGHKKLGGIGQQVAAEIKQRTTINIMYQQLGYVMRSGPPDTLDRMVASTFGLMAMDQCATGQTGNMVAVQNGTYAVCSLDMVVAGKKNVDIAALYDSENYCARIRTGVGRGMFPI